ncbi:MAG: YhbY family RNA-binding protein [Clostridia bacterium]
MITSKQRASLKALAVNIEPIFQIGKEDMTENIIEAIDKALSARELIKISILQSSTINGKTLVNELASVLKAEPVACIGRKMIIYRKSCKKGVKHIEF